MNFYEFYRLLNENTISQELQKISKKDKEWHDMVITIIKDKIDMYFYGRELNIKTKEIFAKWLFYKIKKDLTISHDAGSKKRIYTTVQYFFERNLYEGVFDFLVSNIDQNGNWNPQLASKFNNPSFKENDLKALSDQYHEDLKKKQKNMPGREGKIILSFPDGYSWVDLERGYCDIESQTMGHCGNAGAAPGDTILSLRDSKKRPHLTFILNNGILSEMKGKQNDKPEPKYHPYIIELLKLSIVKGFKKGKYLPENDFKLTDLSDKQIENLKKETNWVEKTLLLDKFEQTIKRPNAGVLNDYYDKELLLLVKFYFEVLKNRKSINDVFSEDEQIEILGNENIKYVDEKHRSKMGETLDLYQTIEVRSKYNAVHKILLKKYKEFTDFSSDQDETAKWKPARYLSFNKNTTKEIQLELLSLASTSEIYVILNGLSFSKYEEVLNSVYTEVLGVIHRLPRIGGLQGTPLNVVHQLYMNPNTSNYTKKEIELLSQKFSFSLPTEPPNTFASKLHSGI